MISGILIGIIFTIPLLVLMWYIWKEAKAFNKECAKNGVKKIDFFNPKHRKHL